MRETTLERENEENCIITLTRAKLLNFIIAKIRVPTLVESVVGIRCLPNITLSINE